MQNTSLRSFDFDEWMRLAQQQPEEFQKRREAMIEAAIAKAPEHLEPRLRGLQWKIDRVRETSANPLAACVRISRMMWDSIYSENGLLRAMERLTMPAYQAPVRTVCPTVEFRRPTPKRRRTDRK